MDWKELTQRIMDRLDVAREYAELYGGKPCFTKPEPSPSGWLACHSFFRQDAHASAAVCVVGPNKGTYKDLGASEESKMGMFEFAARAIPSRFPTWRDARLYYAAKVGIDVSGASRNGDDATKPATPPQAGPAKRWPANSIRFLRWSDSVARLWCQKKGVKSHEALKQYGARLACWPSSAPPDKQRTVIALPAYRDPSTSEVTAWVIADVSNADLGLYQGSGKPMTYHKYLSIKGSTSGIIHDGVADASVIWKVEGVSDMVALKAVAPAGVSVVTNSAGTSQEVQPQWLSIFKGKTVYVCHDCDKAGQYGAARWCKALLGIAKEVRNVLLPFPVADDHGRDVRDFLAAGNDYSALEQIAASTTPVASGSPIVQVDPDVQRRDDILSSLKIEVLGEYDDQPGSAEVFSIGKGKIDTITSVPHLSFPRLLQIVGELAFAHVYEGKDPQPGKFSMVDVRNAIAVKSSETRLNDRTLIGAGVWRANNGETVIVDAMRAGLVKPDRIEIISHPRVGGQVMDFGGAMPWCDFDKLNDYFALAKEPRWRSETFSDLAASLTDWSWRFGSDPLTVASLVVCTWIQTLWTWRPQVGLSGATNAGKTVLLSYLTELFQGNMRLAARIEGPTEAGIRQAVSNSARIIFLDEFEESFHRRACLKLIRTSSSGGYVARGTIDQRGKVFGLRHIVWISAIELGLKDEPDRNRFIVFDVERVAAEKHGVLKLPSVPEQRNLGLKLLAVALRCADRATYLQSQLRSTRVKGVPGRTVEIFAAPAAMIAAIRDNSLDDAKALLATILAERYAGDEPNFMDEDELLRTILDSHVDCASGGRLQVAEIIHDPYRLPDSVQELARRGIAIVSANAGRRSANLNAQSIFINSPVVCRFLLRGTRWEHADIDEILRRVPGSSRAQRMIAKQRVRGYDVPIGKYLTQHEQPQEQDYAVNEEGV